MTTTRKIATKARLASLLTKAETIIVAYKSVQSVLTDYRDAIRQLADRAALTDENDLPSVIDDMAGAIFTYANQITTTVLSDNGLDMSDLSADDKRIISNWVSRQQFFVRQFITDAADAGRNDNVIDARIGLWEQSLATLVILVVAAVKSDMIVTWQLGHTEKHCGTCLNLNGQRHRLSWFLDFGFIPREPGSKTLDCHGFNCDCSLVDDNGSKVM